MKRHLVSVALLFASHTGLNAQTVFPAATIWPGEAGESSLFSDPSALALLQWRGSIAVRALDGTKCLLVARRRSQIVAIELPPLLVGPRPIAGATSELQVSSGDAGVPVARAGSATQMWLNHPANAASSSWNRLTPGKNIAAESGVGVRPEGDVNLRSNSRTAVGREPEQAVTIRGRTYTKYSPQELAQKQPLGGGAEEHFCP